MNKKSKLTIALVLASVAVFAILLALMPEDAYKDKLATVIKVENGKASPEYSQTVVEIKKSGEYNVISDWLDNEKPGFITGFSVADEAGRLIYSTVGGLLKNDPAPIELSEGKYICRFDYLCGSDELTAYMKEHSVSGTLPGAPEWFADGTWEMGYSLRVTRADGISDIFIIICAVALGILLAGLIVTISRNQNAAAFKYDERQIAEQGKSYKYAFFTLLACFAVMMIVSDTLSKYAETSLQIFVVLLIGAGVMLTHSVMHDAYFRLDESKRFYVIFFVFMTLFNGGIGILHIFRGEVFDEGLLCFVGCANLLCAVLSLYLLILILIKKLSDREED